MRNREIFWYTTGLVIGGVIATGRDLTSRLRRHLTDDLNQPPVVRGPRWR